MRDPVRDHARLAGAGAGQYQHRSFRQRNGVVLLRIQALQEIHGESRNESRGGNPDFSIAVRETPFFLRLKQEP